jgi:CheY-like chemotaxis protein
MGHLASVPIAILLIEDNPGDIRLMLEAFRESKIQNNMCIVQNGLDAMAFLRRQPPYEDAPRPDLILLDLNLPGKGGLEILRELKADADLCDIPVTVLTTSGAEDDIQQAYDAHVNCYIRKPLDMVSFLQVVRSINAFWFTVVTLPGKECRGVH